MKRPCAKWLRGNPSLFFPSRFAESPHHRRRFRFFPASASVVKSEFVRSKPHFNVGTIGHVDHGKTSLTSAITKVLSESNLASFASYDKIDNCPEEKRRGITINARCVEYETPNRHYSHVDCPGHVDFVKNMIVGSFVTDGCVLVLAADAGVMPQTREHIILAKQIGLAKLIVFLNKADLVDESTTRLCEDEIREMLEDHGFDGAETPVVVGSAKNAIEEGKEDVLDDHRSRFSSVSGRDSILKLLSTMDEYFEVPSRREDLPSLLSVSDLYSVVGRGTVVAGILESGVVRKGDAVELLGFDHAYKSTVANIETFHKTLTNPAPGDNIGVLVRGVKRNQLRRGMVLAKAGSARIVNRVKARIYLLESDEGGLDEPLCQDHEFKLYSRTFHVIANVNHVFWGDDDDGGVGVGGDRQMIMPGESASMELMLMRKYYFPVGSRFTIRTKTLTIGCGVVTEVLEDADETMLKRRWRKWKMVPKR